MLCGRRRGDGYDDLESNSQSERVSVNHNERPAALYVWSHVHLGQGAST